MTAMDKLEDHDPTETISPSLAPGHRRFSLRVATGTLCFVLSLLFYYGTVLRIQFKHTDLLDLGPYPDAVEYFAQANSILKEGAPTIQIGYDRLPSRYPPGYPVLMIPWLRFLPHKDTDRYTIRKTRQKTPHCLRNEGLRQSYSCLQELR